MQLCLCRSVLCSLVFWSQAESDITSAGTAPAPSSRVHSGKLHSSCFWLLCHRNHQNFQSCSVSTLFSSSSIRGAIGCLNYYRCSTTNWSHYTVHRARQSVKNEGAAPGAAPAPGQKKGLVQFPNCTRNLSSVPWCTNFAQILRPPTAFAAGTLFHQDGG